MKKTILALAAAATIAVGTLSRPDPRRRPLHTAAWVGGGLVAGAIIGGAIANCHPRYYARPPATWSTRAITSRYPAAARAAIGPAGRCTIATATSSAGAARASSALKIRVTGLGA